MMDVFFSYWYFLSFSEGKYHDHKWHQVEDKKTNDETFRDLIDAGIMELIQANFCI